MKIQIKEIIQSLEKWAPTAYAESFDNVGLQLGDKGKYIEKALIAFEITEEVLEEAIENQVGLIITFHPLIFGGLKSITGKNRVERVLLKAIKHDIAIYAIHTNLDAQLMGVNHEIGKQLGLNDLKILIPNKETLFKLSFFVPQNDAKRVKKSLFETNLGVVGNYTECSFSTQGTGTFKPNELANPYLGKANVREEVEEERVEILIKKHEIGQAIQTLKQNHPYEEVAYDIFPLANEDSATGMGQIGELPVAMNAEEFIQLLKKVFGTPCIKTSTLVKKKIKKVAVLGGSGAFAIGAAKASGADAFVTADLKYHDFFLVENQLLLCDVGHYESEQFNKFYITRYLSENFSNFAFLTSKVNTNPINYF